MKENKMATMPMNKLLLNMSIPLMLSLLIQSLYNIIDSIFVARLSEQALTATSLVYAIQFLMIAIAVGTSVGMNALLSKRVGQQDKEGACSGATTGLILVLGTAVIFSLVGLFFSNPISKLLTSDPELQNLTQQYMSICVVFCYGVFLQTYGQRLLQAVGDTVLSMISLIIGAVINICLDPLLIFGMFGFPQMGIAGAALATVIAQWISAASALIMNRFMNPIIHVSFKNYHFTLAEVKEIYRVGLPTIIMQAIGSIMTFAMNAMLLTVSSTAVAFFGVYYKLQSFLMMPMNGLGQAAIPIVGYNYGAGNGKRIKEVWKIIIPVGIAVGLLGTVIFMAFTGPLMSLFSAGEELLAIGIPALRIISVTFVFGSVTILCGYFASGLGNGVINMIGGAIRQLVVLVPVAYVLTITLGISYTWYAFWFAEGLAVIYSLYATRKEIKTKVDPITNEE
ncbi:MAG: MATE family efflux transporter [Erysipelotrichaceae bacterium]|nr:MATE family efflux transporter [Erysipelotrichaceae bacterium]